MIDFSDLSTLRAEALLARSLMQDDGTVDPLRLLLDKSFEDVLWEYDGSRVGLDIPGSLHPKQLDAIHSDAKHRMLFWGNQAGKTTVGAIDCALLALGRHPLQEWQPPVTIWASALTWDLWEQIMLPELLTWIPDHRIVSAPDPFRSSPGRRTIFVRADNGSVSRITGKSAEQGASKYQSARVHQIWFDEEHPEAHWDEAQPRLVRFGGRTITTATPLLGLTWMYHRLYEPWKQGRIEGVWASHAGMADNPSLSEEALQAVRDQYVGDPAQAAARLHGQFAQPAGLALPFYEPHRNLETWTPAMQAEAVGQQWRHVCGIDFGYWRFGFVHLMIDRAGRGHVVREYFSQKESLETRAQWIHNHLREAGAPYDTRIFGDAANPTDILELNKELRRLGSEYGCRAVKAEHKARAASVSLLNNLFARGALLINRKLGEGSVWRRGMDAASDGQPMGGSRLLYEIGQWRYEKPKSEDRVQANDPVDDTADGADLIAALRYVAMSHFRSADFEPVPEPTPNRNRDEGYDRMADRVRQLAQEAGL